MMMLFALLLVACSSLGIPTSEEPAEVDIDEGLVVASPEAAEEVEPTAAEPAQEAEAPTEPAEAPTPEPEAPVAEAEPEELRPLADDQIMILPGGDPPTMDPHLSGDATSAEYMVELYSGLMAYNIDLELIPDVAESYEISEDGTVYTFQLRENAQFQDGSPILAEDFKWSFERACDPATQSPTAATYLGDVVGCLDKLAGDADEISGVEVIDDQTLQITIDAPKGFFLAKMTYPTAYVLDQDTVEGNPDWTVEQPNGSGPFILEDFSPDEGAIVLMRNDNYYRDPQPILERVLYLVNVPILPLNGYEAGLGQLGLPDDVFYDAVPVSSINLSRVTDPNNPLNEEFVSSNSLSVFYIGFNVNEPPFDDVMVRQAFNLALDKRRIVRLVFQDTVPVANGIVPPNMPGYENPDLSDYEYDPDRALALIAESSYGDVVDLPEVTLNVSGSGGEVGPIVEAVIESYIATLGIEVQVEQVPWPDFLADLNRAENPYQMYQLGWIADYPDPQNFLEVLFYSGSGQNHGHYSNPEVDALLDQARETTDPAERLALYQQAEQMILDDAAWIPIYFDVENWLIKPYVQNLRIPPLKIPKLQYVSIAEH